MSEPTASVPTNGAEREDMRIALDKLSAKNSQLLQAARQMGAQPDFSAAMLDSYFEALVALGKITEDDYLAIQYVWEQRFHNTLKDNVERLREMRSKQQAAQAAVAGGIVTPGQRKLIVPGK